ncbi:MAG: metal-dependent phosphohydrolase [Thermoprotei archaeon]|nr:MAG: metal-dependent phosphohydrolase [Thermoprotei archaeon]
MESEVFSSYYHRFSWKEISDPIYGYVYFNREIEEKVINSVLVQRLRYIMQLQTAHLVYPGAVHTRFQHSLGVMHLAGLMAEDAISKIINYYGEEYLEGFSKGSLIEASRLAGLLHDAGHACFCHAFEEAIILDNPEIPDSVGNHERIGYRLVELLLGDQLDRYERTYGLGHLREILMSILGYREPRSNVLRIMRWIIRDSLYPADILDFLRRDSYYAGTHEYGYIDYERLYRNTYPYFENGRVMLLLDRNTWGEFRAYLYAKASMFEHVYYHSVNRAFDLLLKEILEILDEEMDLAGKVVDVARGDPREYLLLTDAKMYAVMLDKAFSSGGKLSTLTHRLLIERKPEWKRIGREYILTGYKGPVAIKHILRLVFDQDYREKVARSIRERLYDKLKNRGVEEEDLWVDVLDISPVPKSMLMPGKTAGMKLLTLFMGKRKGARIARDQEIKLIKEGLPLAVIFRAYIRRGLHMLEYESLATNIIAQTVEEELKMAGDVEEYEKMLSEIYSGYSGEGFERKKITM